MNNIIRNIIRALGLLLFQILVLNNVYLGGYITPFFYVLFLLMLPTNTPKMLMLAIGFVSGFTIDIFSNMLGFHTFAATLITFCRITFADKILTRGEVVTIEIPSIRSVAIAPALYYLFLLFFIYNFAYYALISFSFGDILQILFSSLMSTLAVWILAILYQVLFLKKND